MFSNVSSYFNVFSVKVEEGCVRLLLKHWSKDETNSLTLLPCFKRESTVSVQNAILRQCSETVQLLSSPSYSDWEMDGIGHPDLLGLGK